MQNKGITQVIRPRDKLKDLLKIYVDNSGISHSFLQFLPENFKHVVARLDHLGIEDDVLSLRYIWSEFFKLKPLDVNDILESERECYEAFLTEIANIKALPATKKIEADINAHPSQYQFSNQDIDRLFPSTSKIINDTAKTQDSVKDKFDLAIKALANQFNEKASVKLIEQPDFVREILKRDSRPHLDDFILEQIGFSRCKFIEFSLAGDNKLIEEAQENLTKLGNALIKFKSLKLEEQIKEKKHTEQRHTEQRLTEKKRTEQRLEEHSLTEKRLTEKKHTEQRLAEQRLTAMMTENPFLAVHTYCEERKDDFWFRILPATFKKLLLEDTSDIKAMAPLLKEYIKLRTSWYFYWTSFLFPANFLSIILGLDRSEILKEYLPLIVLSDVDTLKKDTLRETETRHLLKRELIKMDILDLDTKSLDTQVVDTLNKIFQTRSSDLSKPFSQHLIRAIIKNQCRTKDVVDPEKMAKLEMVDHFLASYSPEKYKLVWLPEPFEIEKMRTSLLEPNVFCVQCGDCVYYSPKVEGLVKNYETIKLNSNQIKALDNAVPLDNQNEIQILSLTSSQLQIISDAILGKIFLSETSKEKPRAGSLAHAVIAEPPVMVDMSPTKEYLRELQKSIDITSAFFRENRQLEMGEIINVTDEYDNTTKGHQLVKNVKNATWQLFEEKVDALVSEIQADDDLKPIFDYIQTSVFRHFSLIKKPYNPIILEKLLRLPVETKASLADSLEKNKRLTDEELNVLSQELMSTEDELRSLLDKVKAEAAEAARPLMARSQKYVGSFVDSVLKGANATVTNAASGLQEAVNIAGKAVRRASQVISPNDQLTDKDSTSSSEQSSLDSSIHSKESNSSVSTSSTNSQSIKTDTSSFSTSSPKRKNSIFIPDEEITEEAVRKVLRRTLLDEQSMQKTVTRIMKLEPESRLDLYRFIDKSPEVITTAVLALLYITAPDVFKSYIQLIMDTQKSGKLTSQQVESILQLPEENINFYSLVQKTLSGGQSFVEILPFLEAFYNRYHLQSEVIKIFLDHCSSIDLKNHNITAFLMKNSEAFFKSPTVSDDLKMLERLDKLGLNLVMHADLLGHAERQSIVQSLKELKSIGFDVSELVPFVSESYSNISPAIKLLQNTKFIPPKQLSSQQIGHLLQMSQENLTAFLKVKSDLIKIQLDPYALLFEQNMDDRWIRMDLVIQILKTIELTEARWIDCFETSNLFECNVDELNTLLKTVKKSDVVKKTAIKNLLALPDFAFDTISFSSILESDAATIDFTAKKVQADAKSNYRNYVEETLRTYQLPYSFNEENDIPWRELYSALSVLELFDLMRDGFDIYVRSVKPDAAEIDAMKTHCLYIRNNPENSELFYVNADGKLEPMEFGLPIINPIINKVINEDGTERDRTSYRTSYSKDKGREVFDKELNIGTNGVDAKIHLSYQKTTRALLKQGAFDTQYDFESNLDKLLQNPGIIPQLEKFCLDGQTRFSQEKLDKKMASKLEEVVKQARKVLFTMDSFEYSIEIFQGLVEVLINDAKAGKKVDEIVRHFKESIRHLVSCSEEQQRDIQLCLRVLKNNPKISTMEILADAIFAATQHPIFSDLAETSVKDIVFVEENRLNTDSFYLIIANNRENQKEFIKEIESNLVPKDHLSNAQRAVGKIAQNILSINIKKPFFSNNANAGGNDGSNTTSASVSSKKPQ